MLFSIANLIVCLLCLARAAWKIHLAVLQVSLGDYLGGFLKFIEAGQLLWFQRWLFRAIGVYLARKGYRALVACQKLINRSFDNRRDMD